MTPSSLRIMELKSGCASMELGTEPWGKDFE